MLTQKEAEALLAVRFSRALILEDRGDKAAMLPFRDRQSACRDHLCLVWISPVEQELVALRHASDDRRPHIDGTNAIEQERAEVVQAVGREFSVVEAE